MVYKITAYDQNQKPLPGATVTFWSADDTPMIRFTTDASGSISFNDDTDNELLFAGVYIRVTKDGYYPAGSMAENIYPSQYYVLNEKPNSWGTIIKAVGFTGIALWAMSVGSKKK